jgi:hypothetical protein
VVTNTAAESTAAGDEANQGGASEDGATGDDEHR